MRISSSRKQWAAILVTRILKLNTPIAGERRKRRNPREIDPDLETGGGRFLEVVGQGQDHEIEVEDPSPEAKGPDPGAEGLDLETEDPDLEKEETDLETGTEDQGQEIEEGRGPETEDQKNTILEGRGPEAKTVVGRVKTDPEAERAAPEAEQ